MHHRLRHIYRMNKMIRRFGLTPTPPGRVAVLDDMKVALDKSRSGVGRLLRGSQPGRDYPQWIPN